MEFEAEGGNGEITYILTKSVADSESQSSISGSVSPITITTNEEWITILRSESTYGTIKFEVAENTTEEQRTGYITGEYSTKSFTVTINQAASAGTPEQAFEGWAVVGSFTNNWDVNAAIVMEAIEGYYVARGVEIAATDSFKFAKDGTLQNSLGGNGQAAERDYKYPTSKYGSDIRVAEAGVYDLYLNEATNAYYVMSEGKHPSEAYEEIAKGKDIWYVKSLGESVQLRKSGIFLSATSVQFSKEGFTLYYGLTDTTYGAVDAAVAEVGTEIAIAAESENHIKANVDEGKLYDIYFLVEESKLWVMPRGGKPVVMSICDYAEGVWFDSKNFLLYLEAEGVRLSLDLNSAVASEDAIIPAAKYTVDGEDGNVINATLSEIASNDGKSPVVSGSVTISHIDGGYDILIDVVNIQQHRTLASYSGPIKSNPYMGGPVTNPGK